MQLTCPSISRTDLEFCRTEILQLTKKCVMVQLNSKFPPSRYYGPQFRRDDWTLNLTNLIGMTVPDRIEKYICEIEIQYLECLEK